MLERETQVEVESVLKEKLYEKDFTVFYRQDEDPDSNFVSPMQNAPVARVPDAQRSHEALRGSFCSDQDQGWRQKRMSDLLRPSPRVP